MSLYSAVLGKTVPKTLIAYMNILKDRIGSDSVIRVQFVLLYLK